MRVIGCLYLANARPDIKGFAKEIFLLFFIIRKYITGRLEMVLWKRASLLTFMNPLRI